MLKKDNGLNFIWGLLFLVVGGFMIWIPNRIFSLILTTALFLSFFNAIVLMFRFYKKKNKGDLLFGLISLFLGVFLLRHQLLPQWLIRTTFGAYCLISAVACLIQLVINYLNDINRKFFSLLMTIVYLILGLLLLFNPHFSADLLMQCFGVYAMLLGFRYLNDGVEGINPLTKVKWKRKIRITLPTILCALIPDWALSTINKYLKSDEEVELETNKEKEESDLKVMVHVGPYGFQKVGHISFCYKNIVYSYGNYDSDSFRWNQTLGDGVFFKVPFDKYIPNAMEAENNSVFEFGIHLEDENRQCIENQLRVFEKDSYRWYCKLEREDGYARYNQYKDDYPSRLHMKTGAKFYKIKKGRFKTYWALGDNCALFVDQFLGALGADVLSMRGIISPGTYLEWLQGEYVKKNSPVVSLDIHSIAQKKEEVK